MVLNRSAHTSYQSSKHPQYLSMCIPKFSEYYIYCYQKANSLGLATQDISVIN